MPKYNLYTNRGGQWLIEKTWSNRQREVAKKAAEALVGQAGVQGVRLTRETESDGLINEATVFEHPDPGKAPQEAAAPPGRSIEDYGREFEDNSRSALEVVPKPDPIGFILGPLMAVGREQLLHLSRTIAVFCALGLCILVLFAWLGYGVPGSTRNVYIVLFIGVLAYPFLWMLLMLKGAAGGGRSGKGNGRGSGGGRSGNGGRARAGGPVQIKRPRHTADMELNGEAEHVVDEKALNPARKLVRNILKVSGPVEKLRDYQTLPVLLFAFGALDELEIDAGLPPGASMSAFDEGLGVSFDDCGYDPTISLHETAVNAGRFAWRGGQGSVASIKTALVELIRGWPQHDEAMKKRAAASGPVQVYLYFRSSEPAQSMVMTVKKAGTEMGASFVNMPGTGVDEGGGFLCKDAVVAAGLAARIGETGSSDRWQIGVCGQQEEGDTFAAMNAEKIARGLMKGEVACDELAFAPYGRDIRDVFGERGGMSFPQDGTSMWVARGSVAELVVLFRKIRDAGMEKRRKANPDEGLS